MGNAPVSLSSILVYKRGWRYERPVQVAGLRAASAINQPSRLSCLLPLRDQSLTGVDWLGRWIVWEHPTMGIIAGYVEDVGIDTNQGAIEISVVGHVNILSKRRTMRRYRPASGPPGAIVTRAISDVTLDAGMPYDITVTERGPNLSYEFRAESVMSVFDSMSSASGQEWRSWLDTSRTLMIEWRERVGEDETTRVVFTEGAPDLIGARIEMTISNTVNDLLAIADDRQYSRARGARIESKGSVGRFGRLQDTRHYTGLVNQSTLGPRAQADIRELALPTTTVTLRVPHLDPKLAYVRDGTEFRFVSHSANAVYRLRCLSRDIDLDNGVVTLTCDGVSDVTRRVQESFWRWGGIDMAGGQ